MDFVAYFEYAPAKSGLANRLLNPMERGSTSTVSTSTVSTSNLFTNFTPPGDSKGGLKFSKFNDMACSMEIFDKLETLHFLLLPGFVLGFALGKKEWSTSTLLEIETRY